MKKYISSLLILSSTLFADCNIINMGAIDQEYTLEFKGFTKIEKKPIYNIVSSDSVYANKPKLFTNSENKYEFRTFVDAYGAFYKEASEMLIKECKDNKYDGISNFSITYTIDDKSYYFVASTNFYKKN